MVEVMDVRAMAVHFFKGSSQSVFFRSLQKRIPALYPYPFRMRCLYAYEGALGITNRGAEPFLHVRPENSARRIIRGAGLQGTDHVSACSAEQDQAVGSETLKRKS